MELIHCDTVHIGNYKVIPKDRVLLSSAGVHIVVPSLSDDTKNVSIEVKIQELRKVLVHFGPGQPVLSLYTNRITAERIRQSLGMSTCTGPYYDPSSLDNTQRRITLFPKCTSEESKVVLKSIFEKFLGELENKKNNELLVRASPKKFQKLIKKGACGSAIHMGRVHNEIQTIMVYPPLPAKGGIPINTADYERLGEGHFLNDAIIDFYLKFLTNSLTAEDQARTYVFNSFFYKCLTTKPLKNPKRGSSIEDDCKVSLAEKRHNRVNGWTKNVNIFEKDFIFIPINEHCHWFLAIICFPGLNGCVQMSDNVPVKENQMPHRKSVLVDETGKGLQFGCPQITPLQVVPTTITLESPKDDGSNSVEAEGEEVAPLPKHALFKDPSLNTSIPKETENSLKPLTQPIKQPCILIFDSLAGASRTHVVETLRDYLHVEYKVKTGLNREFNKDTVKGDTPSVPQQSNLTDCGIYLLQYAESFFKNPIKDYHLPVKGLAKWFPEEVVSNKREQIHELLLSLMKKYNVTIEALRLPKLTFSSSKIQVDSDSQ